jgi:hypothetical protein
MPASSKHSRRAATRNASPPAAIPWSAPAYAEDPVGEIRSTVAGIDGAPRKDRCTRTEHRPAGALQHQNVQIGAIRNEDDGGRVTRHDKLAWSGELGVRLGSDGFHPYSLRGASRS